MLILKDICFARNGKIILDNVNLEININDYVAITGPNGSGKSTLAKIIMGLELPDSGQILFNDTDITKYSIAERSKLGIAFAFQNPVKFKGISVRDILNLSAKKTLTNENICDILATVGLCANEYSDRELNTSLSGGEMKRIEIAGIILKQNKLTIFDEPEAGIDLWSFNNLINIFNKQKEKNNTTLIITHQEKILKVVDKILLLEHGRVSYFGNKDQIIDQLIKPDCEIKGGNFYDCCR